MPKSFKIIARKTPDGVDFDYKDFESYADAFQYCFTKARQKQCDKVELYECPDPSNLHSRLCPIAEFYHW